MGLVARHTNHDVLKELKKGQAQIERGIIRVFQFVGETFAKDAKENLKIEGYWKQRELTEAEKAKGVKQPSRGDYVDRTGNLRSSIGYFILINGRIFNQKLDGTQEGISAAIQALNDVPNKSGYQLIGVAGMDYASHVESKGYNVITSQSTVALIDLKSILLKFKDRYNRKGIDTGFGEDDLDFGYISSILNVP